MTARHADTSEARVAKARRWRLPLSRFDRYLIRGVAMPFAGLLLAVTVALLLERALRLIHELAGVGADLGYFLPLLLQFVPYYIEAAIPLAFMIALVALVARLDERLELEAMLASGLSLMRVAAPLVGFGFVLAAVALVVGGWLEPVGRHGQRLLMVEAVTAGRLAAVQPLAIYRPGNDLAVTFDERAPDGRMRGIFLWQRLEGGGELVITGGDGRLGLSTRERVLAIDMAAGRYAAEQQPRPYALDFNALAFRQGLRRDGPSWKRGADPKEMTLSELLVEKLGGAGIHEARLVDAEIYSRVARALLIPLVPMIVLPLAFATKKGGRALGVFLCSGFVSLSRHALGSARNIAELGTVSAPLLLLGTLAVLVSIVSLLFLSARSLPSHSLLHSLLNPVSNAASRLAPDNALGPRGRGLASYLLWELTRWTLLALATVALFMEAIDLVERGPQFLARGFGGAEIARYALLQISAILQQSIPIAALGGAMAAFAVLASRREVTAMRAAGVSQWRLLAKVAPVALLLSVVSAALAEWATPATQSRLAGWWAATEPATPDDAATGGRWFRIGDQIVHARSASADGRSLDGVEIYLRDRERRLAERIKADRAVLEAGGWVLRDAEGTLYRQGPVERTRTDRRGWDVALDPADVDAFFSESTAFSAASAQRALDRTAPLDQGELLFATRLHRSAAEPLAPFAMLLFALPIAFVAPRTGRAWPALLYGAGAGLLYLVGDGILTVSAQMGYVPPLLGAWAAPVLAILVGLTVLVYAER